MENYKYSDDFSISGIDARSLADRLRVDVSIITFNADLLRQHCYYFIELYVELQKTVLGERNIDLSGSTLDSKEMALALEYFLQMDGKLLSIDDYHIRLLIRMNFVSS